MNIITKIKLKRTIKNLTNQNKAYKLYKLVKDSKYDLNEVLNLLNKEQIALLTKGAMQRQDNDFLIEIAVTNKYADINQIIKYLITKFNNIYYDYEYHLSFFIGTHFNEFLNGAIQNKNNDLIYYLAYHASQDPIKYAKGILRLKKYYLTYPVNKDTIEVAKLPGFNTEDLENKIIKGSIYLFMEYLNTYPNKEILINKFIKSNPTILNFKYFLHNYLDSDIFNITLEILLHNSCENIPNRGNYLLAIYSFRPTIEIKNKIEPVILGLKEDPVVKNFMRNYNEDEQNKLCTKYLQTNNATYLFNLAITTNCTNTYQVIDKVIKNHHHLIIPLITKLKNRFLNYTLAKLINEKGANYYLNIIYTLIDEMSPDSEVLINFIYTYNYVSLFTPESLKKLKAHLNNNQNFYLKK